MRLSLIILWTVSTLSLHSTATPVTEGMFIRQDSTQTNDTVTPTASAGDGTRPTAGPTLGQEDSSTSASISESISSGTASRTASRGNQPAPTSSASLAAASNATVSANATSISATQTQDVAPVQTSQVEQPVSLPLPPRLTPAFGIAGVILIVTGIAYSLIGVKHRFLQVFLSNGYLAALSITVLIDYVMKPPISNAIQGAYFVAIFMSGCIYGAGSLLFKEVTEGFGCLLGGFCLSMWFLCLKAGGLIAEQTGKAIMIAIFSVLVWSLSFSHHTREYGLIGSTSFAGATAFVLGIDCFSGAGLKEFWFYIWELNENLFPLDTDTYPMTRGMIVELIVIILVTVIGVFSQIKLWKLVRARRDRRDAIRLDDERRRDVVDEVIGRHLEKQNEKDRPNWEKQYGNTLHAKRSTILWTSAHPDQAITQVMPVEDKRMSTSVESLGSTMPPQRPRSKVSGRNLRQSTLTVNAILEEEEDANAGKRTSKERLKALSALDPTVPADAARSRESIVSAVDEPSHAPGASITAKEVVEEKSTGPEVTPLPFTVPTTVKSGHVDAKSTNSDDARDSVVIQNPKRASKGSKRNSLMSLLGKSPRPTSEQPLPSASVEMLVLPSPRSSRASSLAATLDEEDRLSILDPKEADSEPESGEAIQTVAADDAFAWEIYTARPPSPQDESDEFEEDPEALFRPLSPATERILPANLASTVSGDTAPGGSDSSEARDTTAQSSVVDGLTLGALESIPKQTSHVVLSYRTNEWAKHIADADEPIFAEPEQLEEGVGDAPVRLAPVTSVEQPKTLSASTAAPPPHVAAADHNGIVAVMPEPLQAKTSEVVSTAVPVNKPATRPSLKGKRSSTLNAKKSFLGKAIDENAESDFAAAARTQQRMVSGVYVQRPLSPSADLQRGLSKTSLGSIPAALQSSPSLTMGQNHPYMVNRSSSYNSLSYKSDPRTRSQSSLGHSNPRDKHISRSSSMMSGINLPMRSETRLDTYDSRQPAVRNQATEQQRREAMLADWRTSQQQGGLVVQIPKENVEHRRAQMLLDREHRRLLEDQQKSSRQHQQMVMDTQMRRPEMQDAHREAMKRMQAGVNRNL